jgi:hypothetical protein
MNRRSRTILIIAPYYFPYINPRAYRWTVIAEQLARQPDLKIHVLTSQRRKWDSYRQFRNVHIFRTGFNSVKEWLQYWKNSSQRRGEARQLTSVKKHPPGFFSLAALRANNLLLRPFYWPDDAFIWKRGATRSAQELMTRFSYDAVISVSLPFTAHLVAEQLLLRHPQTAWIADIGDPFSLQDHHPINNYRIYRKKNRLAESRILQKADCCVVTNPGAIQLYQNRFPDMTPSMEVIPPTPSPLGIQPPSSYRIPLDGIHIGYFGSFFKSIREPGPLLECLNQIAILRPEVFRELHIHFFGDIFENFSSVFNAYPKLSERLQFHGMISRKYVIGAMRQMDFLINAGNRSSFQLPSKSVDYLQSGKPVIHLNQDREDPFRDLFQQHPLYLELDAIQPQWEENVSQLCDFLLSRYRQRLSPGIHHYLNLPYSREKIVERYRDLIFDAISTKNQS